MIRNGQPLPPGDGLARWAEVSRPEQLEGSRATSPPAAYTTLRWQRKMGGDVMVYHGDPNRPGDTARLVRPSWIFVGVVTLVLILLAIATAVLILLVSPAHALLSR